MELFEKLVHLVHFLPQSLRRPYVTAWIQNVLEDVAFHRAAILAVHRANVQGGIPRNASVESVDNVHNTGVNQGGFRRHSVHKVVHDSIARIFQVHMPFVYPDKAHIGIILEPVSGNDGDPLQPLQEERDLHKALCGVAQLLAEPNSTWFLESSEVPSQGHRDKRLRVWKKVELSAMT